MRMRMRMRMRTRTQLDLRFVGLGQPLPVPKRLALGHVEKVPARAVSGARARHSPGAGSMAMRQQVCAQAERWPSSSAYLQPSGSAVRQSHPAVDTH